MAETPARDLAELATQARTTAERITTLAACAGRVPFGAQAAHALLQAATQAEVAAAYLDAAQRDAERAQGTEHQHPEPCAICGRPLPFAPPEDEPAVCAVCQGLAEPTGLSLEDTLRLEDPLRHLVGPAHAEAMRQAWADAFPSFPSLGGRP